MATRVYPAIFEPAADGGYGVYFPDLPGCTSGGDTIQEAAENAVRALALHVAGMADDGEAIPEPSAPDKVEVPDKGTMMLVPVDLPGRTVRLNITMDEGTLALADKLAAVRGTTRSGLLAELVRQAAAVPVTVAVGSQDLPHGRVAKHRFVVRGSDGWIVGPGEIDPRPSQDVEIESSDPVLQKMIEAGYVTVSSHLAPMTGRYVKVSKDVKLECEPHPPRSRRRGAVVSNK